MTTLTASALREIQRELDAVGHLAKALRDPHGDLGGTLVALNQHVGIAGRLLGAAVDEPAPQPPTSADDAGAKFQRSKDMERRVLAALASGPQSAIEISADFDREGFAHEGPEVVAALRKLKDYGEAEFDKRRGHWVKVAS